MVLNQNLPQRPDIGDMIIKDVISNAKISYPDRDRYRDIDLKREDYSLTSDENGTIITLDKYAELNGSPDKTISPLLFFLNGYNRVWLGRPTILRIDAEANVSGNLYGKYMKIESNDRVALLYFGKRVDLDEDSTEAPSEYVSFSSADVDAGSDTLNIANHGFSDGENISIESDGATPGGISSGYEYFVKNSTANSLQLSITLEGDIKDITSAGSGNMKANKIQGKIQVLLESDNMTAEEVAEAMATTIEAEIDIYETKLESNKLIVYTKDPSDAVPIQDGDTGFYLFTLMVGSKDNQTVVLSDILEQRDFIKPFSSSTDAESYFEIIDVGNKSVKIKETYTDDTQMCSIAYKQVGYVNNDTHLYLTISNQTGTASLPKAVKSMLIDAGLEDRMNLDSFDKASIDAPYLPSLKIPETLGDTPPTLKSIIEDINQSIIGSLVLNNDLELVYNILDVGRISSDLHEITDHDIYRYNTRSAGKPYKDILVNYRFTDITNRSYSYNSEFSEKYTDGVLTLEANIHLYNKIDVEEMAQRRLIFNSLSRTDITIYSSLKLRKLSMGDKVVLNFKELYYRLGNASDRKMVGAVTSVTIDGENVTITVSTHGADLFNKNSIIVTDDGPEFVNSTDDERLFTSYITNNDGSITDDDELLNCNIIA